MMIDSNKLVSICEKHIDTLRIMQKQKVGWENTVLGARIAEIERLILYIETEPEELIRCKDCKHWNNETEFTYCNYKDWIGTEAEDFCSFGERIEE